jgi:CHAT domain-containing protein
LTLLQQLQDQQGGTQYSRNFIHVRDQLLATYLATILSIVENRIEERPFWLEKALTRYENSRLRALKSAQHRANVPAQAKLKVDKARRAWLASLAQSQPTDQQARLQQTFLKELRDMQKQAAILKAKQPLVNPFNLATLQEQLKGRQAEALVFAKGLDQWYVFAIAGDRLDVFPISQDPTPTVRRYRNVLSSLNRATVRQSYFQAKSLYRRLLADALADSEVGQLFIVADGLLQLLPFETLRDQQNRMLCDRFNTTYLPALTFLSATPVQHFDPAQRFIFGNPRYSGDRQEVGSLPDWPKLNHGFWQADDPNLFVDHLANRQAWLEVRQTPVSILHASAHAVINDQVPELSAIILSTYDQSGQPQAGEIFAYEIETQLTHAQLVVLAACRSGDGFWYRGEGIWGLSQSFLASGSRAVVVSLWDVEDRATELLMTAFYDFLDQGYLPAEALRAAKLRLQQHPVYSHPGYWSAFVLQGDLWF